MDNKMIGIYIRVSTQEQVKEGFSIQAQRERLKAYCAAQGWTNYKFYVDEGVSAKDMKRPQLQALLKDMKEDKIKLILVYRLDRFTRKVKDLHKMLEMMNEHNCGFKSATEIYDTTTAMGRLFITIVAALAEWETENMSERIKMVLSEKVAEDKIWIGPAPYPFDKNEKTKKLVINERRSAITLDMIEKFEEGMSLNQLAQYMTETNGDKETWHVNSVIRILRNPALYGATGWLDKIYENTHHPLITKERFEKIQKMLADRTLIKRRDVKGIYIFQGVIACTNCGHTLTINRYIRKNKDGSERILITYRCGNCITNGIKTKAIGEERFLNAVYEYMKNVEIKHLEQVNANNDDKYKLYEKQLLQIEKKREKYQRAWANDLMTDEEFKKMMDETRQTYEDLKRKLDEYEKPATLNIEEIKNVVSTFNQNFRFLTKEEKKAFVSTFIRRIEYKLIPQPPKNKRNKVGKDLVVITNIQFF